MAIEEWIRLAAVLLQATAILVTSFFAVIGLRAWRSQMLGKRRLEVAEETLVLAHKIRNAIAYVRLPVYGPEEGHSRPKGQSEREFARLRDSYFVPIGRLRFYEEDFAKLERQRLLCETYFGPEAGKPLAALANARRLILAAARGLLSIRLEEPASDEAAAASERWEAVIRDYGEPEDGITRTMDEAVEQIERVCRPYLSV